MRELNVVVVVLDAARADHFGTYGYPRKTTPHIDAIAEESVVFDRAHSDASYTIPSIASLFSGLPPTRHGVTRPQHRLSDAIETLSERLRLSGRRTGAFVENPLLDPAHGYGQGFDVFEKQFDLRETGPDSDLERIDLSNSREHVAGMLEWIDADPSQPFFLYAHFLRPHNPYWALPEHAGRFSIGYRGDIDGSTAQLVELGEEGTPIPPQDLQQLIDLYDENLFSADALVGDLVAGLEARQLLERTVLVITSDHGESFREHGRLLHGYQVFEEDILIPLLVRFPRGTRVGPKRVQAFVQLSDLRAMLIEVLGESEPSGAGGSGPEPRWVPILASGEPPDVEPPGLAVGRRARALFAEGYKLIRIKRPTPRTLLFDLAEDPREKTPRTGDPETRKRLERLFRTILREDAVARKTYKGRSLEIGADRLERLRALGYATEPEAP